MANRKELTDRSPDEMIDSVLKKHFKPVRKEKDLVAIIGAVKSAWRGMPFEDCMNAEYEKIMPYEAEFMKSSLNKLEYWNNRTPSNDNEARTKQLQSKDALEYLDGFFDSVKFQSKLALGRCVKKSAIVAMPTLEIDDPIRAKGKTKYGQMSWGQNQTCEKRNATQEMKDFAEKLKTDYVESVKQKAIERVNNVKLKKCGQPSIEGYKMIYENGFPRNAKLDWQNAKNYKVKNGKLIAA